MRASLVRIGRTFNLGNYESERIDVEITINEGESFEAACVEARQLIDDTRTNPKRLAAARKLIAAGFTKDELLALGIHPPPHGFAFRL